jgi:hypothetical protein
MRAPARRTRSSLAVGEGAGGGSCGAGRHPRPHVANVLSLASLDYGTARPETITSLRARLEVPESWTRT